MTLKQLFSKHAEKIRFVLVGGINTVVDFAILFILFNAIGLDKLLSNVISTSTAMVLSYFMNQRFTFKAKKQTPKQFVYFVVITLIGLWVIQSAIISVLGQFLGQIISNENVRLLVSKIIATGASMLWNFVLYKKFVFINSQDKV